MTAQQPERLRVFLSWSLPRSEAVAQAFRDWLPSVLQNVRPYYTPDDIGKGARWASEIRNELEESDFGLIFLTPENLSSPWILFEAGALSKLEKSQVAPILIDLEPTDVSGPIAQMQLTKFNKEECFKLVKALNRALDSRALDPAVLNNVFEKWWPELSEKVQAAVQIALPTSEPARRPERELLEEVLERVRALQLRSPTRVPPQRRPITPEELAARPSLADVLVRELGLTARTYMSLRGAGIRTLDELVALSDHQLLLTPNLGRSGLSELRHAFAKYGLEARRNESE